MTTRCTPRKRLRAPHLVEHGFGLLWSSQRRAVAGWSRIQPEPFAPSPEGVRVAYGDHVEHRCGRRGADGQHTPLRVRIASTKDAVQGDELRNAWLVAAATGRSDTLVLLGVGVVTMHYPLTPLPVFLRCRSAGVLCCRAAAKLGSAVLSEGTALPVESGCPVATARRFQP